VEQEKRKEKKKSDAIKGKTGYWKKKRRNAIHIDRWGGLKGSRLKDGDGRRGERRGGSGCHFFPACAGFGYGAECVSLLCNTGTLIDNHAICTWQVRT